MPQMELSKDALEHRKELVTNVKEMILGQMNFESGDDFSIQTAYKDFYLQISFSYFHPLMVICLIRNLQPGVSSKKAEIINELNLKSVLGCHVINDHFGFYHYRSTHWLDAELKSERFFEILDRCYENACRGYASLH